MGNSVLPGCAVLDVEKAGFHACGPDRVVEVAVVQVEAKRAPFGHAVADEGPFWEQLAGKSVCFTGELMATVCGRRLSRDAATALACEAGLIVAPRVTRGLDFLVLADVRSMSGKAKLARKYGIPLLAEWDLWRAMGLGVS